MKIAFITTTINKPVFLIDYIKQFKKILNNQNYTIEFFIIGDRKSPKNTLNYLKQIFLGTNFNYHYFDEKKCNNFLRKNPFLKKIFPINNAVRKYIGNLIAYKNKFDLLMMVDDDNFLYDTNYLKYAISALKKEKISEIATDTGWFNVYHPLKEKNNLKFYPRGFPWSQRNKKNKIKKKIVTSNISFINGLVIKDPDIDAISRLFAPIEVIKFDNKKIGRQFALAPGTWCSFNNQNSIIPSKIAPVHFTPPSAGRNSDIWSSFFLCKLSEYHKEHVVFGSPLVKQIRNVHNLWDDLELEFKNNRLTDFFVALLKKIKLSKKNRAEVAKELCIKSIIELKKNIKSLSKDEYNYIYDYFYEYLLWLNSFTKVKL